MLRLYQHYKNGHLPVSGGILDQSAALLRAFEVIDDTVSFYQRPTGDDDG